MIDGIKKKLSKFRNSYDIIRIVDPVTKKTFVLNERSEKVSEEPCCNYFKNKSSCENCVSMKSYLENDTFVKVEYLLEKIYIQISTPIELGEKNYIVEILKDITGNGFGANGKAYEGDIIRSIINEMNARIKASNLN